MDISDAQLNTFLEAIFKDGRHIFSALICIMNYVLKLNLIVSDEIFWTKTVYNNDTGIQIYAFHNHFHVILLNIMKILPKEI